MNEREFIRKCKDDIVFFAEHMLRSEDGAFYKLEDHQKAMMTSKEGQVVYFCGRRLGKSFMLAVESIHLALFSFAAFAALRASARAFFSSSVNVRAMFLYYSCLWFSIIYCQILR